MTVNIATADTTAPSIPTALTATAVSSSQINLSWSASTDTGGSGLAGYKIYRNGALIATTVTTGTTFQNITGLSPNTTYTYTVAAYDNAGNTSAQSVSASATTYPAADTTAPSTPTSLTATAISSSQISLSWSASTDTGGSGLAGYKVYRGGVQAATTTAVTYANTNLSPSTTYVYTVAAYDNAGNTSAQSISASATTPAAADTTPPGVSMSSPVSGSTVSGVISLNASASDNVGVTKVEFYVDSTTMIGTLSAQPYSTSYNTVSLSNTSHTFTAKAYDAAGNTAYSSSTVTVNNVVSNLPWAKAFGSTGTDMGYSVASDTNGNIFVAGYFNGTVDFGGGPLSSLASAGGNDIFVAKYSASGAHIWSQRFGGTSDDQARSIVVDSRNGDVVMTGYFSGTVAFGSNTYTSFVGRDAFLVKLSGLSGTAVWSKQIGGTSPALDGHDYGNGVAVDPNNGDVVLAGEVQGFINFGGGLIYTASMNRDSFVVRYSDAGVYRWAKISFDYSPDWSQTVVVDNSGNVLLSGGFVAVGPDWGGGILPGVDGKINLYLVKFTSSGTHVWSKSFFTTNIPVTPTQIATDAAGNVIITGYTQAPIDFGSGVLNFPTLQNNTFLVKFSGINGTSLWSKALVADAESVPSGLAVDSAGNIAVSGSFTGSINLVGGTHTSTGGYDVFAAKYSGSGSYIWSGRYGGSGTDLGKGAIFDSSNLVLTGATYGGDFGGTTLPSTGGYDAFLMKLVP